MVTKRGVLIFTKPSNLAFLNMLNNMPEFRENQSFAGKFAGLETAGDAKKNGFSNQTGRCTG